MCLTIAGLIIALATTAIGKKSGFTIVTRFIELIGVTMRIIGPFPFFAGVPTLMVSILKSPNVEESLDTSVNEGVLTDLSRMRENDILLNRTLGIALM